MSRDLLLNSSETADVYGNILRLVYDLRAFPERATDEFAERLEKIAEKFSGLISSGTEGFFERGNKESQDYSG